MIQSLHTAASGMKAQQRSIDTIANNISNMETLGYKKERANFKDALYTVMMNADNAESTDNLQKGTGVIVNTITKVFTNSNYKETGYTLDVALMDSESFFVVEQGNGERAYTRDGSFKLSNEEDGAFLVTNTGSYVLDENENRISFNQSIENMRIDEDGAIYLTPEEQSAKLGVVKFETTNGLLKLGDNQFMQTEQSGQATIVEKPQIKHKVLEQSNVDLAEEMTNLIKAQRAYQMASKVLKTSDEMEERANNLRR